MKIKSIKHNDKGYLVYLIPNWFERLLNIKPKEVLFIPNGRRLFGGYTVYINGETGERDTYEELDVFIRKEQHKIHN